MGKKKIREILFLCRSGAGVELLDSAVLAFWCTTFRSRDEDEKKDLVTFSCGRKWRSGVRQESEL